MESMQKIKHIIDDEELMMQWDWNKNNELGLDPKKIAYRSHIQAWWRCRIGHSYKKKVYDKTYSKRDACPICNGKQVLPGFNDLATTNSILAKQWHPTKNNNLTPQMVTAYSNKKVWWQCEFGHEWESSVANRSIGRNCPICSKEMRTSFPEQAILFYLNKTTPVQNRCTTFGKEIDVYLPEYKIGIEYNGKYWHKNKTEIDKNKVDFFRNKGIRIISVIEAEDNIISYDTIQYIYDKTLDWCIINLLKIIGINDVLIDTKKDRFLIYDQYITMKKKNSFGEHYPQLAEEWLQEKNGKLTPYMVSCSSNKIVWWKCKDCGHEWEASVNGRSNGSGCIKCSNKKRARLRYIPIYCKELDRIFDGAMCAERELGILHTSISMCLRKRNQSAGRHPITGEKLHWYYVYDQVGKDGSILQGALSLGYITQTYINEYKTIQN